MKALHLIAPEQLALVEKQTPHPRQGQVLIKVAFSPINPSDLAFLTGQYGIQKPYPIVPGFEASGTVVESGGGLYANYLKGKKVACVAHDKLDGPWAEYMVTDAAKCVILGKNVSLEQGALSFVNPLTALDFIRIAKAGAYDSIVMSAAAGALAKLTHQLAKEAGLGFAGIVRKPEQVSKLKSWGVDLVVNSEDENWREELKTWSLSRKKILFPDAIGGGSLPAKILSCLPPKSKLLVYGSLDFSVPATYVPREFIFKEYEISGYWLSRQAKTKGFIQTIQDTRKIQRMMDTGFENDIQARFGIEDFQAAIETYTTGMSKGKVLFSL